MSKQKQFTTRDIVTGIIERVYNCTCGQLVTHRHINKILTRDSKLIHTCSFCNNELTEKHEVK